MAASAAKRSRACASPDLRAASPDRTADSPDLPAAVVDKCGEERCAANADVCTANASVCTVSAAHHESLMQMGVRLMNGDGMGGMGGMMEVECDSAVRTKSVRSWVFDSERQYDGLEWYTRF